MPGPHPSCKRCGAQRSQCRALVGSGRRYWGCLVEVSPVPCSSEPGERKEAGKRVAPRSAWAAATFGCFVGDFYMLVQTEEPSMLC